MPLDDMAWMSAIPDAAPPQASPAAPPSQAPAPSFPMAAPHLAPDGSGAMTNLSDADYAKFMGGQAPAPAAKTDNSWMAAIPDAAPQAPQHQDFPVAPGQMSGTRANIGAGIKEGVTGMLGQIAGAPLDLAMKLPNLALKYAGLPQLPSAMGAVNDTLQGVSIPSSDVSAASPEESVARAAARGVGGMAAGGLVGAGVPALAAMASPTGLVAGAAGGALGDVAKQAAPDAWKPAAELAGNVIGGGLVAGARAGIGAASDRLAPVVSNFTAPFTKAGQTRLAAQEVTQAATDPVAARAALEKPETLVTDSPATSYQITADRGLGDLERRIANDSRYNPQYQAIKGVQNNARVAAIQQAAPPVESAQIGPWFRQQLSDLNAAGEAETEAARAGVTNATDAAGNVIAPHQAGAVVRQGVADTMAPTIAAFDRAIAGVQTAATQATDALGGVGATAQEQGARMRGQAPEGDVPGSGLEGARMPVKAAASRLFDHVDPDGTLALDVSPVGSVGRELAAGVNTRMGDQVAPVEQPLLDAASRLRGVELFSDLRQLRTNTGNALRTIRRDPGLGAESPPYRRMSILMNSIDDTIAKAAGAKATADEAAVRSGVLAPDQALSARLQTEHSGGSPQNDSVGGGLDKGNVAGPGAGQSGVRGTSIPGEGGRGSAASDSGVAPPSATNRPRAAETLHDFLISRGGIRDQGGELRVNDLQTIHHRMGGRLLNPNGLPLDRAQELAAEAGFIRPNADINEFLDAVTSPTPVHRISEAADASIAAQRARDVSRENHDRFMAATAGEDELLQRNAERNAVGAPGVPLAAQQAEMQVGRAQLEPNFTAKDQNALRTANAAYRDYKERFRTGTVGEALASDSRTVSGYRLPDSAIPAKLFSPGTKGADAADSLIHAMGSREGALHVLGDYPAMSLRGAAEEMGMLSVPKYQKWMKDHAEVMAKFPELADQFGTAAKARAALDGLREQRAAIEAAYPIKPGWGDAEIMQRFVVPGPKGYEGAQSLLNATRASPTARAATEDYLASSLRDAAEVRSGPKAGEIDPGAYRAWMKRYDSFLAHPQMADVRARFRTVGEAQAALDKATAAHVQARKAFETSVARHFLGQDTDPVTAIGSILESKTAAPQMTELARVTAADPVARQSLQRAAIEYMMRKLRGNQTVGGDLDQTYLRNEATQNFIRSHVGAEGAGALRSIMEPGQLAALDKVARDIRRANLSNQAPVAGAATALNESSLRAGDHRPSTAGVLVALETAGELAQGAGELVAEHSRIAKVGGIISAAIIGKRRQMGFENVENLVAEAVLHPSKMKALFDALPTPKQMPSRMAALKAQIAGLAANSMQDNRK